MKLKVKAPDGGCSLGTEIYVDGKKLKNVTSIAIDIRVDCMPKAVISFLPESVEVDGDFEVLKKAEIDSSWFARGGIVDDGIPAFIGEAVKKGDGNA